VASVTPSHPSVTPSHPSRPASKGAGRAAELGWNAASLFGCRRARPLAHPGGAGLLWAIQGGRAAYSSNITEAIEVLLDADPVAPGVRLFEGRRDNLSQANKLSRTYAVLLDALNRHRGKEGKQKVTVEHVDVHAGGQAVVGIVESPRGGDQPKSEDQAHAKQIAHAPQPAVWSADKERQPLPVSGDAERPLPDARRDVPGRPEGLTQMLSSTDTIRLKQSRPGARLRSCYGMRGLL
jgi:hypothetical protein